ncbi:GntR family transcriptional regulator [Bifidobacterium vansinderenii]|uniref:GntR family transcriptional regulator n=1 Tax=Bifidobacterium vansinderenii TaxID=1984871 RepID=A0A229VYE1_9BIFI|nr:GntR family transcriptional regulator [Bifidobacterium vansinderenii]OXN00635.1 GntR family transcriptional regulator [Bifidobacterium vansinderenii]
MTENDLMASFTPSQIGNIPLYEQVASFFKQKIQSGALNPGDRIPTETSLSQDLGISRTTIRQAMDSLVNEGLIIRQRRRGSFVASPKMRRPLNYLYNFTENMRELGATPQSRVLACTVDDARPEIAEKLQLPDTQRRVFHLWRLRCADGNPILLEDTFVPYHLCPGIEDTDFSTHSLYQTLATSYSLNLFHATETIEAIIINTSDAQLLDCKSPAPGYRITRTSHLDTGLVFEYTKSVTNAERCMFQMELYRNPAAAKKSTAVERKVSL